MIADFDVGHAFADAFHDTTALVPEDNGEGAFLRVCSALSDETEDSREWNARDLVQRACRCPVRRQPSPTATECTGSARCGTDRSTAARGHQLGTAAFTVATTHNLDADLAPQLSIILCAS